MNILVYDCEIANAILDNKTVPSEKITYCKGWDDFAGMGISCIGLYAQTIVPSEVNRKDMVCLYEEFKTIVPVTSIRDELGSTYGSSENFQTMLDNTHILIGFNNQHFDDNLIKANGFNIPEDIINYDILAEVWEGAGLGRKFIYPSHAGFGLDAICKANNLGCKTGNGTNAALLWQQGFRKEVIDYCQNDIKLTVLLFNLIQEKGEIVDPRQFNEAWKYHNPGFEFKPIKVKTLSKLVEEKLNENA